MIGKHLKGPPDIVGKHHYLKIRIVICKLPGGDRRQSFPLGLSNQILCTCTLIILIYHLMGLLRQVRDKYPIHILAILKKLYLNRPSLQRLLHGNMHDHKTTGHIPPHRLIATFIVFNHISALHLVPSRGIKRRIADLIAKNKPIPLLHGRPHRLPTDELPVSTKNNIPNTAREAFPECTNQIANLLSSHRLPTAQLASKILTRLTDKTQHRTKTLLAALLRIMPLSSSLLIPVNGLHRGINIHMNTLINQST